LLPDERHRPMSDDEPPPFLGTWNNVYLGIVLYLAALIALFGWFSAAFTPAVIQ
jgi:hypothetical protein